MAGNEKIIAEYLFKNIDKIKLKHLGLIKTIGAPTKDKFQEVTVLSDIKKISSENSQKKADIYINGKGVSLKQQGSSFPFNRLQRAELLDVFSTLNLSNAEERLLLIDNAIVDFHEGRLKGRSRPWKEFFDESDFKSLIKYLMMEGSPNLGQSSHPAEFILEAPKQNINDTNIHVYTFDEYFEKFKCHFKLAIRRQWVGQSSDSEHKRASGLAQKEGNQKWVFNSISGSPRKSKKNDLIWRKDVPVDDRRTVFILFVEKTK